MSNPAVGSKPKEFQSVNHKEKIHLLSDAAHQLAPAMVWTLNRGSVFNSRLNLFNQVDKVLRVPAPKPASLNKFTEELVKFKTKECYFCVSHPHANLFFATKLINSDSEGLYFSIPKELHKVQRRSNYRFQIPIGRILKVEFKDPLFAENILQKKVFDISAGGLSFLTSEADSAMFTKGLVLDELTFTIRTKKIVTSAEVRYTKPISIPSSELEVKVGLVFKSIERAMADLIALYVNDESRKIYINLL